MNEQRSRIPESGTVVGEGPDGQARARIMQGGHAQIGPVHVAVLAARHRGAEGRGEIFARLMLGNRRGSETIEVSDGDVVDLDEAGALHIVQIAPQDPQHAGPDMPARARGAVFVEHAAPKGGS